jgi:hypothetical protein
MVPRTFQFNRDLTLLKPSCNKFELTYSHWGGTDHGELRNPRQRRGHGFFSLRKRSTARPLAYPANFSLPVDYLP